MSYDPTPSEPDAPLAEPSPSQVSTTSDDRTWGLLAHLSAFAGYVVPFGNVLGPLVVWLVKKDKSPFVDGHGKEALNFQISILIYLFASVVLGFVTFGFGFVVTGAIVIFKIVMIIVAALKANNGELFRYPLTIRFIK